MDFAGVESDHLHRRAAEREDGALSAPGILPTPGTICAVLVTYHPDAGLFARVEKISVQVAQTVIVDNGSTNFSAELKEKLIGRLGVHVISNDRNEGIARALNKGVRWAASHGYPWALTLDQDTVVGRDMVESLADVFRRHPSPPQLAVIGSNYRDKITGKLLCKELAGTNNSRGREMITVLTSGSLVSVHAFQIIGGFRSEFFIDNVDHEYCLRARTHGFLIAMTAKPVMEHGIGAMTEHRFLWKKIGTSDHAPVRHYFMTRNTLILAREYLRKEPRWILGYLWAWVKLVVLVCLFEKNRMSKMKNVARGCVDGVLNRTGWEPR